MISFLVSTYNRPNDLRVMLSSLIAQTSPAWECFVMDEGDNWHVVGQLNDERIKWRAVERKTVEGVDLRFYGHTGSMGYLPKHEGVRHAKGSHVAFTSEDIYYLPKFVEYMDGHSEDIVGCDAFINYARLGFNCLRFAPQVTFADCANYIIKPETYKRHPFTEFMPEHLGTADGLCVQRCAEDGASVRRVPRYLVMHGQERP